MAELTQKERDGDLPVNIVVAKKLMKVDVGVSHEIKLKLQTWLLLEKVSQRTFINLAGQKDLTA